MIATEGDHFGSSIPTRRPQYDSNWRQGKHTPAKEPTAPPEVHQIPQIAPRFVHLSTSEHPQIERPDGLSVSPPPFLNSPPPSLPKRPTFLDRLSMPL